MASLVLPWTAPPPRDVTRGAVTFGNFDGVHRGHRELVAAARRRAEPVRRAAAGGGARPRPPPPPPPLSRAPRRAAPPRPPLTSPADKARLLHESGADHVVFLKTDAALLSLSPWDFFERVIRVGFAAHAVVEG